MALSFCSSGFAGEYPAKLVEPLKFHDEFVEITDAGTLRRRYKVWGDYDAEVVAWKAAAKQAPARTFRLGCIFLKDAKVDMWVWCAGSPKTLNGTPKQKVSGPP